MRVGDIVRSRNLWGGNEHSLWLNENIMSEINNIIGWIGPEEFGLILETIEPNDQGLLRVRILCSNGVIGWTHASNLDVITQT